MIREMKQIPVTESSYPFQSAEKTCGLKQIGYKEEEIFMTGTANIYTETDEDHHVKPIYENAPYTTRILVRCPQQKEKFSGNVVLEILNASGYMDIDRMWVNLWPYMTNNGDIYIGITSKGHVVESLKRFDPRRYAPINWSNPMPDRKPQKDSSPFGFLPQYESGLYWDMQTELAKLLRKDEENNPIREYVRTKDGKIYLYLTGWSQSGSYMSRTIQSFSYRSENISNGPLFNGYLEAGADASLAPINAYETGVYNGMICGDGTIPKGGVLISREPYIAINTECENRGANWIGDSDKPGYKFRTYQIPGTSHDSYYNLIGYYKDYLISDVHKAGKDIQFKGADGEPMDAPYEYIFHAALRNLYVWVREGVPAPHAPAIDTVPAGENDFDALIKTVGMPKMKYENRKDMFGNTTGGIRSAWLDNPIGVYKSYSVRKDGGYEAMFGTVYPFEKELLINLYGSLTHYRQLVEQSTDETIALGFLLQEEKQEFVDKVVELAEKRGLR